MSEVIAYTGKIKQVSRLRDEDLEDVCLRILSNTVDNLKDSEYFESWEEYLLEEGNEKYVVVPDKNREKQLYEIVELNPISEDDVYVASRNSDSTINFTTVFYDGNQCLTGAIEESVINMINKEGQQTSCGGTQSKTSQWIKYNENDGCDCWGRPEYITKYKCNHCGYINSTKTNYCPNCGIKKENT